MNIGQVLKDIGLSEKAADIYKSLLPGASLSVQEIAQLSNIRRTTVYDILEQLLRVGLVGEIERNHKRLFFAHSPDALRNMLLTEEHVLEARRGRLEEVLPFLQNIHNREIGHPRLFLYEGIEGLLKIRQVFLETEGDVMQVVPLSVVARFELILKDRLKHVKQMTSTGGYKGIAIVDEGIDEIPTVPGGEVRTVSKKILPTEAEITIRGDRIFLFSYTQGIVGVMLESPELAEAMRGLFLLAWSGVLGLQKENTV